MGGIYDVSHHASPIPIRECHDRPLTVSKVTRGRGKRSGRYKHPNKARFRSLNLQILEAFVTEDAADDCVDLLENL